MLEFLILIIVIICFPRKTRLQRKIYCFTVCIGMCLLVGLRNINIGQRDTLIGYIPEFIKVANMSYSEILVSFKDPIYYCTTKVFHLFSDNEYAYLFVYGIPYNAAIAYFVYKYSKDCALSFLAVMGLSIWKIGFTGMRHVLAAACLIVALDFLIENKAKWHFIWIAIATCFHSSALIFLLVYPTSKIKNFEKFYFVSPIMALCAFVSRNYITKGMSLVFSLLHIDRYLKYVEWTRTGNGQGFILYFVITITLLLLYKKTAEHMEKSLGNLDNQYKLRTGDISFSLLNTMQVYTLLFNALAIAVNEFARVATFFGITTIIFIPAYLQFERNKRVRFLEKSLLYIFLTIMFLFVVAPRSNIIPYYFNWENYH